jgi:hypothetical protein
MLGLSTRGRRNMLYLAFLLNNCGKCERTPIRYMNMVHKNLTTPWVSEEDWAQVVFSVSKAIEAIGVKADTMRTISQQIVKAYADIATVLDTVCLTSCPACSEVCCARATVWYDLKDLLTIYLNTDAFPAKQICRLPDHSCCNLTPSGCRLIRSDRPFICTWYICPDQKIVFDEHLNNGEGLGVLRVINDIKKARKELEHLYISAVCG